MNYNFIQKKLHNICLNNNFIKKSLFELENLLFYEQKEPNEGNHVFITGLPRSGTTILLENLYNTNEFASLTYAEMPFILSPNLISKINPNPKIKKIERMHSDGIFYDLKSPEAFEEVFFLTYKNDDEWPIKFKKYISLILKKNNKHRYLSKNNYNFKRIQKLNQLYPNAKIIIPFRDPLNQSFSMLNQHLNFIKKQQKDKFILNYMNYLGHFEFGLNHKSWMEKSTFTDLKNVNYWLEQWYLSYDFIMNYFKPTKNLFFLCYEKFCENKQYQISLKKRLDLNSDINFKLSNTNKNYDDFYDIKLYSQCKKLYEDLISLTEKI